MIDLRKKQTISDLRSFLDSIQLSEVLHIVRPSIPVEDPWPVYSYMKAAVNRLPAEMRDAFGLFVLGDECSLDLVEKVMGSRLVSELIEIDLLRSEKERTVSTHGRGVVPFHGYYVFADLPSFFPTARWQQQQVFVDRSTMFLARMLPGLPVESATEVCAGAGLLSLVASGRARNVVSGDINPEAVNAASFNAILNGLDERVRFVESDLFEQTGTEPVDLIIGNPPYLAIPDGVCEGFLAGDGGGDGMSIVSKIFEDSAVRLQENGRAYIMAASLGSANGPVCQTEIGKLAERHSWETSMVMVTSVSLDDYLASHAYNFEDPSLFSQRVIAYCASHALDRYFVFLVTYSPGRKGRFQLVNPLVENAVRARDMRRVRNAIAMDRR